MNKNEHIDLVYPLGGGTAWKNNELRFSLRSVEKNLKNVRRIYIIGEKPAWLKNTIHIPCEDTLKNNPDGNIIRKILRACRIDGLSEDFLFMNDDYLVLKPIMANIIPPFHKGNMADFEDKYFKTNKWRESLGRTKNILVKKGYQAYHYDGHIPMIINKKKFPVIMAKFDYEKTIYTMKSLYGNLVYDGGVFTDGIKKVIFRPKSPEALNRDYNKCTFAAVNDQGMTLEFKKWVFSLFPDQSKYERTIPEGMIRALYWFNNGMDIKEGINIYSDYGKSGNVKKFIKNYPHLVDERKLSYHLNKLLL